MKKGLVFAAFIILLITLSMSCIETDEFEFCDIRVENKTNEDVELYYLRWMLFTQTKSYIATVNKKTERKVSVPCGRDIYIVGKDTNRELGPRHFYYNDTWIVP